APERGPNHQPAASQRVFEWLKQVLDAFFSGMAQTPSGLTLPPQLPPSLDNATEGAGEPNQEATTLDANQDANVSLVGCLGALAFAISPLVVPDQRRQAKR